MTDDEIALWLITKGTMEDKPVMSLAADRVLTLRAERDEAQADWRKYEWAWMTAEGKLADAESDIAHLHKLLAHAASDLTSYVNAEYPPETCAQYPDIARRHYRDMDLVRRIEAEIRGGSHE